MPQIMNQKLDWGLLKRLKFLFWVFDWTNFTQFWISLQTVFCIQQEADFSSIPTKHLSPNCGRNFLNGMSAASIINIDLVLSHSKIKHFPFSWVPPVEANPPGKSLVFTFHQITSTAGFHRARESWAEFQMPPPQINCSNLKSNS